MVYGESNFVCPFGEQELIKTFNEPTNDVTVEMYTLLPVHATDAEIQQTLDDFKSRARSKLNIVLLLIWTTLLPLPVIW